MANVRQVAQIGFCDPEQGAFTISLRGDVSIKRLWVPSRDQQRTNEVTRSDNLLLAEIAIF